MLSDTGFVDLDGSKHLQPSVKEVTDVRVVCYCTVYSGVLNCSWAHIYTCIWVGSKLNLLPCFPYPPLQQQGGAPVSPGCWLWDHPWLAGGMGVRSGLWEVGGSCPWLQGKLPVAQSSGSQPSSTALG